MSHDLTHASFFSGVGGLDLGLERAGWRTVSFSEIDPYASAVLAERWPGVPNLGDIVRLDSYPYDAALWTGGFPCQDLSIAGKRRGIGAGTRSGLAYAFLDLVERHRPPAILLENVPGLLSSHRGRDLLALLRRLEELGYGWAFRVLDARYFGVPQRRRRVFILGLRSDPDDPDGRLAADRAAEVLAVGTRCRRHPPTGVETGEEPAEGAGERIAQTGTGHNGSFERGDADYIIGPSPDPGRDGAPDGMAGRMDDREYVAYSITPHSGQGADLRAIRVDTAPAVGAVTYGAQTDRGVRVHVKTHRAQSEFDEEIWRSDDVSPTLNGFDVGSEDDLLPLGLDSHRYRCCGNGVVSSVAEWIGLRLAAAL